MPAWQFLKFERDDEASFFWILFASERMRGSLLFSPSPPEVKTYAPHARTARLFWWGAAKRVDAHTYPTVSLSPITRCQSNRQKRGKKKKKTCDNKKKDGERPFAPFCFPDRHRHLPALAMRAIAHAPRCRRRRRLLLLLLVFPDACEGHALHHLTTTRRRSRQGWSRLLRLPRPHLSLREKWKSRRTHQAPAAARVRRGLVSFSRPARLLDALVVDGE